MVKNIFRNLHEYIDEGKHIMVSYYQRLTKENEVNRKKGGERIGTIAKAIHNGASRRIFGF